MDIDKKEAQKENMKKFTYFIFGAAFLIFLIAITAYFINLKPIQQKAIYASVNITEGLGFDVNESALTFGAIAKYGTSSRNVFFSNDFDFPIIVKIKATGDIAPLLEFEEVVRIEPGEQKKIAFAVFAGDRSSGYYEGNVEFKVFPD